LELPKEQAGGERASRTESTANALVARAIEGDRQAIAKLISIIEDGSPSIGEVMTAIFPHTGRAHTVGITGAPGAGKSTLTEGLIGRIREDSHKVGVLAVDPSSPFTGGALLGDRVRMQSHAADVQVFIRSMATRGHLGGLSLATPEAVRILDAAGCAYILIETVGVGQDEVDIVTAADTTVVVLTPGWGDSVQAGKAGLLEIGDVFVVNKADREGAKQSVREINQMLDFGPQRAWRPPVLEAIATEGKGVGELWAAIKAHQTKISESGELDARRRSRIGREISDIVAARVRGRVRDESHADLDQLVERVVGREIDPYAAAEILLDILEN
jgi:LAO/AO transport system kinase